MYVIAVGSERVPMSFRRTHGSPFLDSRGNRVVRVVRWVLEIVAVGSYDMGSRFFRRCPILFIDLFLVWV